MYKRERARVTYSSFLFDAPRRSANKTDDIAINEAIIVNAMPIKIDP